MSRLLRPLTRAVTYTRWLHLCIPLALVAIWLFIDRDEPYLLAVLIFPVGFISAMRGAEGLQALFLLTPDERGRPDASIATAPAVTWADRWRTVAWLELRLLLAGATLVLTIWLPMLTVDLVFLAGGHRAVNFLGAVEPRWWFGLLVPVAIGVVLVGIVALGELVTVLARLLLSPSPAERLAALEARNEQLLERTRIARELHDAIGHALTITVMQAGAARAANDPAFTEQALSAIENTGRAALEDLDRVLLVLRESVGTGVGTTHPDRTRPAVRLRSHIRGDDHHGCRRQLGEDPDRGVPGGIPDPPGGIDERTPARWGGSGARPGRRRRRATRACRDQFVDRTDAPAQPGHGSARHPRPSGIARRPGAVRTERK